MTQSLDKKVRLVKELYRLHEEKDRARLAALRTGLGKRPGTATRMFPIVSSYLQTDEGPAMEAAFITASLFASHPHNETGGDIGSLGASLWRSTRRDANPSGKHLEDGVSARVAAALDADPEDLQRHLEGLVSLCESAGQPIDWHRFYLDLCVLLGNNEERRVRIRTRWAREFWGGPQTTKRSKQENDSTLEATEA
jgi:CRISPR type I-E-associated protein CasB/Cse2